MTDFFNYLHPGLLLKGHLNSIKLSQKDLSIMINRPQKTISEIVKGKKSITVETALDLELALDKPATYWLLSQMYYDLQQTKKTYCNQLTAVPEKIRKPKPVGKIQRFKEQILQLDSDGFDCSAIAERLGLKYNSVYFALRRWK